MDRAAKRTLRALPSPPPEGWIATVRKGLGMSGQQLAKRLGVTRARVHKIEQDELKGSLTPRTIEAAAAAMGCRFVYAIVPEGSIEDLISEQARRKAETLVERQQPHGTGAAVADRN